LARIRQPIFPLNWNFLSLSRFIGTGQKRASLIFNFDNLLNFIIFVSIIMIELYINNIMLSNYGK
jgi:hypothetical protein